MSKIHLKTLAFTVYISVTKAKVSLFAPSLNQTVETSAWDGLMWDIPMSRNTSEQFMYPLIPLHVPIDDQYDPCDSSTFTVEVMTSVLSVL